MDAGGEIVYPPQRGREVFQYMEFVEVRTEALDNMVEEVSAYNKVIDAVIYSCAFVL